MTRRGASSSPGDPSDAVRPKVVLLVAYRDGDAAADEASRWLSALDFSETASVAGVEEPVHVDPGRDVALAVTGVGNVEAALSVSNLLSSPRVDCRRSYFLTVGAGGTSPRVAPLGSVVLADHVLDWDQKHRLTDDGGTRVEPFRFKSTEEVCKPLNPALVEAARRIGSDVSLADAEALRRAGRRYPFDAATSAPGLVVGASVSGSEFWHGSAHGDEARRLVEAHGAGTYATTEMEGFGTARALERHGHLDRYLSVRGISNFDRPRPGQDAGESVGQNERGLDLCLENVHRVASAVVEEILGEWDAWREGVPARYGTGGRADALDREEAQQSAPGPGTE